MKLSIVTTVYYSSPYIMEFYKRIRTTLQKITDDYEIIFVNDGSPDNSLEVLLNLFDSDNKVKILDLSRNYGHYKAIMTGLSYAKGEYIFLIDIDLEEEPELLGRFWSELQRFDSVDVVYGVQEKRKGKWFERLSGALFYKIFNYFSSVQVPVNLITSRLMRKKYVDALVRFKEQEIFLSGLLSMAGFNQRPIMVKKLSHSPSTYSLSKKISLLVNAITSFSNKPLLYIFYMGTIISISAFIYSFSLIIKKLFFSTYALGWASLIASMWLIGGIIIFSIGILGIYLSKIFSEVKQRPYTIINKYYSKGNN